MSSTRSSQNNNSEKKPNRNSVKVFKPREPCIERLTSSNQTINTVGILTRILIITQLACTVARDCYHAGRLYIDLNVLYLGIGSFSDILFFGLCLSVQHLGCLLVHPTFKAWRWLRASVGALMADTLFLLFYMGWVVVSWWLFFNATFTQRMPAFLSAAYGVEMVRLTAKIHSFIRENVYKVLYPWNKEDESGPAVWYQGQMDPKVGSFSQYLYFLFAPTLLYRDHYPRTTAPVNWIKALTYLIEFLALVTWAVMMGRDVMIPESMRLDSLVAAFLRTVPVAFFTLVLAGVCLLHCWSCFGAELTRFADREFHREWWNAKEFTEYYRDWNLVVYEWLHAYLYHDGKKFCRSPAIRIMLVFLTSACAHDILVGAGLGYFLPNFLVCFGVLGMMCYFVLPQGSRENGKPVVILAPIFFGFTLLLCYPLCVLSMKKYCHPNQPSSMWEFFWPPLLECYQKYNS